MQANQNIETTVKVLIGTLPPSVKARLLRDLQTESTPAQEQDRIIRRTEAARLLARSTRAVDYLVSDGTLKRITFPGRSRAAGFRLSDVKSLIGG